MENLRKWKRAAASGALLVTLTLGVLAAIPATVGSGGAPTAYASCEGGGQPPPDVDCPPTPTPTPTPEPGQP